MPLVFFLLLVVLIAQLGFWDTLVSILGAAAMVVLFFVVAVALVALAAVLLLRRVFR